MSDNSVLVLPCDPVMVPDEARLRAAVSYFRSIAPDANDVNMLVSERIVFVDCGSNFERVRCPSCRAVIELRNWRSWMDLDFDGEGFTFAPHSMPCCGAEHLLNELTYEWPQGFSRCQVYAVNPHIGELSDGQRRRFEQILGCPVRVVYRHV
jgi:hypothetical protein